LRALIEDAVNSVGPPPIISKRNSRQIIKKISKALENISGFFDTENFRRKGKGTLWDYIDEEVRNSRRAALKEMKDNPKIDLSDPYDLTPVTDLIRASVLGELSDVVADSIEKSGLWGEIANVSKDLINTEEDIDWSIGMNNSALALRDKLNDIIGE